MDIISRVQLNNMNKKKYDFISRIDTPYHLINLKAFLKSEFEAKEVNGLILVGKHPKSSFALKEGDIQFTQNIHADLYGYIENGNEKIGGWVDSNDYQLIEKTKMDSLYIIHPERPWAFFSIECKTMERKVINIVIDDGIGSYNGIFRWTRDTICDTGSVLSGIKYLLGRILGRGLLFVYGIKVKNFSFFQKKNFANKKVSSYIKTVIEQDSNYIKPIVFEENSIVYLSQPFSNHILYERTLTLAGEILKKYQMKGYNIYIKYHPREKRCPCLEFEGVKTLPYMSIENIIAASHHKPGLVIGWTSTALITLSCWWNIKCLSMCKLDYRASNMRFFVSLVNRNKKFLPNLCFFQNGDFNEE